MTYSERNTILLSSNFIAQCRIALCDWVEYWTINGVESIEDEVLRGNTEIFLRSCLINIDSYLSRIAILIISSDILENAEEVTDDVIKRALDNVLSNALSFLI